VHPTQKPLCRKGFSAVSGDLSGAILARKPLCPMGLLVICRVSGAQEEKDAGGCLERKGTEGAQIAPDRDDQSSQRESKYVNS